MIRKYSARNFYSLKEKNEISLLVKNSAGHDLTNEQSIDGKNLISKVTAIFGSNASGKTNLLKGLAFLRWFNVSSFRDGDQNGSIPLKPFQFDPNTREQKTEFNLEYEFENSIYSYQLILDGKKVWVEELSKRSEKTSYFNFIFRREWDGELNDYTYKSKSGFKLPFNKTFKPRPDASTLSTAAQAGHEASQKLLVFWDGIIGNIVEHGRKPYYSDDIMHNDHLKQASKVLKGDPKLLQSVQKILQDFDLGIKKLEITESQFTENEKTTKKIVPTLFHEAHGGTVLPLAFYYESGGTQTLLTIVTDMLVVLSVGGIAVLDEFDSDLHPHMLPMLMNLFYDKNKNPNKAQLIISAHSPILLSELKKEQIILVEKEKTGETTSWRLDTVSGVRKRDNLMGNYLAGAYGGVPNFD